MDRLQTLFRLATTNGVPRRAAIVALIVGATLNLINQGDAILYGGHVNLLKVGLTFVVPYLVSTHGAVMARL